MKNLTVSLPSEIYRRARITAAERDTSVSALVREFLSELAGGAADFKRRKRLQAAVQASIKSFRASDGLPRHELHERALR